ncbi:polyprenyl synthetase family protein [Microbacterium halophytorum]|uniref:polyprenyl synthetase family protein n=1 Tax=Microbacterium halophytorum TaxID=2067568 RepID=UPI000CFD06A8|nr:polyprenyl synthetase family protein [Microbacterium halophytorum]
MLEPTARLGDVSVAFERRLMEVIAERRERSRAFATPYGQLWDSLERMARGGKKLRPRLLLDAYQALGGIDERAALDAACALELLHMALVIHDDVIDKDLMRRGEMNISGRFASEAMLRGTTRRSANAWGEASSLLAGDLMLTLAHSLLARLDLPDAQRQMVLDIFDDTVFESAAGEHYDVWLSMHLEPASPRDVLAMVDQKTAAYSFQAPLALAAVLVGASAGLREELAAIARQIGVIYQLRDDVLGLFGDERETGKSILSDLREGKETLLIAYARSDDAWAEVEPLFGDEALSPAGGHRLRRVVEESGALVFVESLIAERSESVLRLIQETSLPDALREQLAVAVTVCSTRAS